MSGFGQMPVPGVVFMQPQQQQPVQTQQFGVTFTPAPQQQQQAPGQIFFQQPQQQQGFQQQGFQQQGGFQQQQPPHSHHHPHHPQQQQGGFQSQPPPQQGFFGAGPVQQQGDFNSPNMKVTVTYGGSASSPQQGGHHHHHGGNQQYQAPTITDTTAHGPFDEEGYFILYPDARYSGRSAFDHFKSWCREESKFVVNVHGVRYVGAFDVTGYLRCHPDLAQRGITDAWKHYVLSGHREGRDAAVRFQPGQGQVLRQEQAGSQHDYNVKLEAEAHANRGVYGQQAYTSPYQQQQQQQQQQPQYGQQFGQPQQFGQQFGQFGQQQQSAPAVTDTTAHGKWDEEGYYTLYPQARYTGRSSFDHFKSFCREESKFCINVNGTRYVGAFDVQGYLRAHPDLGQRGITDAWKDYVLHGHKQGKDAAVRFQPGQGQILSQQVQGPPHDYNTKLEAEFAQQNGVASINIFASSNSSSQQQQQQPHHHHHNNNNNNGGGGGGAQTSDTTAHGKWCPESYYQLYPEARGQDSFQHFTHHHREESKLPIRVNGAVFWGRWHGGGYVNNQLNPDLVARGMRHEEGWKHYQHEGHREGRDAAITFPPGQGQVMSRQ